MCTYVRETVACVRLRGGAAGAPLSAESGSAEESEKLDLRGNVPKKASIAEGGGPTPSRARLLPKIATTARPEIRRRPEEDAEKGTSDLRISRTAKRAAAGVTRMTSRQQRNTGAHTIPVPRGLILEVTLGILTKVPNLRPK